MGKYDGGAECRARAASGLQKVPDPLCATTSYVSPLQQRVVVGQCFQTKKCRSRLCALVQHRQKTSGALCHPVCGQIPFPVANTLTLAKQHRGVMG